MKNLILCFSFCFATAAISAQTPRSGNLLAHIDSILGTIPGNSGDDYPVMTPSQLATWHSMLEMYCQSNFPFAESLAQSLEYEFIEFSDVSNQNTYHIFQKADTSGHHWGTYVFNANPCRTQLSIQAPHPKKDFNTGKEATWCFYYTDASSLAISGTSRCNNSSSSACDGSTSVCSGSSEPYRVSDQAHIENGAFQVTTSIWSQCKPNHFFVQLHGFSKLSTDSFLILSNGSQDIPQSTDYLGLLGSELQSIDDTLSYVVAHQDQSWTRLIALTNTQGRLLNNSPDACDDNGLINSGQFLHVEQEKTRLRDDSVGWNKMRNALIATFDCTNTSMPRWSEIFDEFGGWISPNPAKNKVRIQLPRGTRMSLLNFEIVDVQGRSMSHLSQPAVADRTANFNITELKSGIYFIRVDMYESAFVKHFKFIKL